MSGAVVINKEFGNLERGDKIALFAAWVDGKTIEVYDEYAERWNKCQCNPVWSKHAVYRVAPNRPSINWDHVHPDYICMATDMSGTTYLFNETPRLSDTVWCGGRSHTKTHGHVSFKSGSCYWKDSLVYRPGHEPK